MSEASPVKPSLSAAAGRQGWTRFIRMLLLIFGAFLAHLMLNQLGESLFFSGSDGLLVTPDRFRNEAGEDLSVRRGRTGEPMHFRYTARISGNELAAAAGPAGTGPDGLFYLIISGLKAEGYEVRLNGSLIGELGDVRDGRSDIWNTLAVFPVSTRLVQPENTLEIYLRGELVRGFAGGTPVVLADRHRAWRMTAYNWFTIIGLPMGGMTLLLGLAFVSLFGRLEWRGQSTSLFAVSAVCFAVYLTDFFYLPSLPFSYFTFSRIETAALYVGTFLIGAQMLLMLRRPWPFFVPLALLFLFWILGLVVSRELRVFSDWYTAAFWTFPVLYVYLFVLALLKARTLPTSRTLVIVVLAFCLPGLQLLINDVLRMGRQVLQAGYLYTSTVVLFLYISYQEYRRKEWEEMRHREAERETLTRVVRNLNHDVSNILTSVQAPLDLLGLSRLEPVQESYRRAAGRAVDEIHLLLAGLLALRDRQPLDGDAARGDPIDLDALLDEVIEVNGITASRRGIDLFCWMDPRMPRWFSLDMDRLRIVLMNLVGNALKFTPAGWVLLRTEYRADEGTGVLTLRVTDTGPGIPSGERGKIFTDGYRSASNSGMPVPGQGVGLSICDHLAREAGWRLEASTPSEGGTTFTLDVPCRPRAVPDAPGRPADAPLETLDAETQLLCFIGEDEPRSSVLAAMARRIGVFSVTIRPNTPLPRHPSCVYLLDERSPLLDPDRLDAWIRTPVHVMIGLDRRHRLPHVRAPDGAECIHPVTKPLTHASLRELCRGPAASAADAPVRFFGRVIIADDDYAICAILEELLQRMGLDVVSCRHGGEALEAMADEVFDVVILDQNMPYVDGLETARRIRALPDGRGDTFIIGMVSANARDDGQKAIRSGMDWIVSKPVHREVLQRALLQADLPNAPWEAERSAGSQPPAPLWGPPRWMELSTETRAKVLEALRGQAPQLITSVRQALAREDLVEMDRLAHQLQNWFNNVGIPAADRLLRRMDTERRAGRADSLRDAADRLIRALPLVTDMLSSQRAIEDLLGDGTA